MGATATTPPAIPATWLAGRGPRLPDRSQAVSSLAWLTRGASQPPLHLSHPRPADAQVAGERGPVLELARIEEGLVVAGQLHPIRACLGAGFDSGFPGEGPLQENNSMTAARCNFLSRKVPRSMNPESS